MKLAVIGLGRVGSSLAFALTQTGKPMGLYLEDINKGKEDGEKEDLRQAIAMSKSDAILLDTIKGCDTAFISAGIPRYKTDIENWITDGVMFDENLDIVGSCVDECVSNGIPKDRIYVITNPSDLIAHRLKCRPLGEKLHDFRKANDMKDGHWILDHKGYTNWGIVVEALEVVKNESKSMPILP